MNAKNLQIEIQRINNLSNKGDRCGFCLKNTTCTLMVIGGGHTPNAKYLFACDGCAEEIEADIN